MNWKGYGKKQSSFNLMKLPRNLSGVIEENHEQSIRIAGLQAEI
jgi:hypothetical protein